MNGEYLDPDPLYVDEEPWTVQPEPVTRDRRWAAVLVLASMVFVALYLGRNGS